MHSLINVTTALTTNVEIGLQFEKKNNITFIGGVLGSPRHSPHLWFIPSAHLDFFAIFVIPSPHLDLHSFTSLRVKVTPSPHLFRQSYPHLT